MEPTAEAIKVLIRTAFADTPYPGDGALVRSVGDEPDEVVELFRGRDDWRALPAEFVDRAGAASPSALSFFSPGAFRFYLPAYLMADLDGRLVYTDPLFYLYFGLDEATRDSPVNVPGEGATTWGRVQQAHFAGFTAQEASAVVAYLRFKAAGEQPEFFRQSVREALENYWLGKAGERQIG
ncbi:MAG TPA: DUF6714 family protein [Gemmatimonadales bacterium]